MLSDEGYHGLSSFSAANGVSMTGLVNAFGERLARTGGLGPMKLDNELLARARDFDAQSRSRRQAADAPAK